MAQCHLKKYAQVFLQEQEDWKGLVTLDDEINRVKDQLIRFYDEYKSIFDDPSSLDWIDRSITRIEAELEDVFSYKDYQVLNFHDSN